MPLSSTLKSLLTICVLADFAFSTVGNYKCAVCFRNSCIDDEQRTCEASHGCFNHKQELKLPGQSPILIQEKGCSLHECVPLSFTASLGNKLLGYGIQCCQEELCNKGDIQVSQNSSVPNGVICPACYIEDDVSCEPVPLACTGTETKCIEVFGSVFPGVAVFAQGCATETACNLKKMSIMDTTMIHTSCRNHGSGSSQWYPLSHQLISFFLLKVLL
ncbi:protein RoBo-1-like [Choloepus didactylus]|uniref:protein RoBo-1-like n=1 Tax=Choloepus didactylus TaxID=27675 RepID=UPI0018A00099|nr:protein RoBo-1-like [Choloepus didactylus]XP_037673795.1 protein RoBo-1-like [Choloepus didactylus]XP_037673796.1 protein RoBo-1-like [Choloepus didactylus]